MDSDSPADDGSSLSRISNIILATDMRRIGPAIIAVILTTLGACDSGVTPESAVSTSPPIGEMSVTAVAALKSDAAASDDLDSLWETLLSHVAEPVSRRAQGHGVAALTRLRAGQKRLEKELVDVDQNDQQELQRLASEAEVMLQSFVLSTELGLADAIVRRMLEIEPGIARLDRSEIAARFRSAGKTDTCERDVAIEYAAWVVSIEAAFAGALYTCAATGAIAIGCAATAYVVKTTALVAASIGYSNDLDTCRRLAELEAAQNSQP